MGPSHLQLTLKINKDLLYQSKRKKANPWDQPGVFKLLKAKDYPKESVKIRKIEEKKIILNKIFVLPEDSEKSHYTK